MIRVIVRFDSCAAKRHTSECTLGPTVGQNVDIRCTGGSHTWARCGRGVPAEHGPRPPLPPTPKPNFFTPGKISTHFACDNKAGEIVLPLSISCKTRLAFRRVSSSFALSAASAAGTSSRIARMKVSEHDKFHRVICRTFLSD